MLDEHRDDIGLRVFYPHMAAHAVMCVALVWFIYQLLRAAERMVLPRHMSNYPEVVRAMLGITSPHGQVQATLKEVAGLAGKVKGGGAE